ncbi:MAG: DUF4129 domain-containing protein [Ferruginibacter sp.]
MLRSLFIIFFLCCVVNNSQAQTQGYVYSDTSLLENGEASQADVEGADTILYKHEIAISADTINAWKTDKRFAYVKNLDSLLKAAEKESDEDYRSVSHKTSPSFLQKILSSGFVQVIFWMIAIGIVLFILYKLFLNQGIFKRSSTALTVKEIQAEQTIIDETADYDALIRQSFKLSDYRMAVRYLFLKTLRQLSDKGMLQRSVEKTNFQYVQEIPADKKNDFASLVLNYEYVWYGNLDISREQFEQIERGYTSFYNKI